MAQVSGDLVENKIEEKITKKAASKTSHEDPSKSMAPTQIDENSVQPIKIPKGRQMSPENDKLQMNFDYYKYIQ